MRCFFSWVVLRALLLTFAVFGVAHAGPPAQGGSEMFTLAADLMGKKVLLVHSYHREHPWVINVEAGVRAVLGPVGVPLESLYMDTKRHADKGSKVRAGKLARQKVQDFGPDVIIASDDNAQEYFAKYYAGVPGAPRIVYCAVNADPEVYGYPADNVAGIVEQVFFERSLVFLRKMVPEVDSLLVLSDQSPSSLAAIKEMQSRRTDLERIEWKTCRTFTEWKRELLTGQSGVDAVALLTYHTLRDNHGHHVKSKEVMTWTAENLSRPSIGFFVFTIADGALCGIAQSGFEHGFRSGGYALEMLKGRTPREIGTDAPLKGVIMVNTKAARRIGLPVPKSVELLADGVIE